MKSTGIVRPLDNLGRVVIPKELRRTLGWETKDGIAIYVDGNRIVLEKYVPACIFCNGMDDVQNIEGKNICKKCMTRITNKTRKAGAINENG